MSFCASSVGTGSFPSRSPPLALRLQPLIVNFSRAEPQIELWLAIFATLLLVASETEGVVTTAT